MQESVNSALVFESANLSAVEEPPRVPDTSAPRQRASFRERALVRRAQRGSSEAAATLFDRHWGATWRAALAVTGSSALADECAQDAFERAFARLASFDAARPFAPWVHRIAVNRAIDVVRRESRLVALDDVTEPGEAMPEPLEQDLLAALGELSLEHRSVVVLRYLLDYRPPEIAEMLGLPTGTVNSRLARALERLRERLEDEGD